MFHCTWLQQREDKLQFKAMFERRWVTYTDNETSYSSSKRCTRLNPLNTEPQKLNCSVWQQSTRQDSAATGESSLSGIQRSLKGYEMLRNKVFTRVNLTHWDFKSNDFKSLYMNHTWVSVYLQLVLIQYLLFMLRYTQLHILDGNTELINLLLQIKRSLTKIQQSTFRLLSITELPSGRLLMGPKFSLQHDNEHDACTVDAVLSSHLWVRISTSQAADARNLISKGCWNRVQLDRNTKASATFYFLEMFSLTIIVALKSSYDWKSDRKRLRSALHWKTIHKNTILSDGSMQGGC